MNANRRWNPSEGQLSRPRARKQPNRNGTCGVNGHEFTGDRDEPNHHPRLSPPVLPPEKGVGCAGGVMVSMWNAMKRRAGRMLVFVSQ